MADPVDLAQTGIEITDASTRGRSNRLKGQRGERELANELSDLLGITLKRRVQKDEWLLPIRPGDLDEKQETEMGLTV